MAPATRSGQGVDASVSTEREAHVDAPERAAPSAYVDVFKVAKKVQTKLNLDSGDAAAVFDKWSSQCDAAAHHYPRLHEAWRWGSRYAHALAPPDEGVNVHLDRLLHQYLSVVTEGDTAWEVLNDATRGEEEERSGVLALQLIAVYVAPSSLAHASSEFFSLTQQPPMNERDDPTVALLKIKAQWRKYDERFNQKTPALVIVMCMLRALPRKPYSTVLDKYNVGDVRNKDGVPDARALLSYVQAHYKGVVLPAITDRKKSEPLPVLVAPVAGEDDGVPVMAAPGASFKGVQQARQRAEEKRLREGKQPTLPRNCDACDRPVDTRNPKHRFCAACFKLQSMPGRGTTALAAVAVHSATGGASRGALLVDSAAGVHVVNSRHAFAGELRRLSSPVSVDSSAGVQVLAEFEGDAVVSVDGYDTITLYNALYIQDCPHSLICMSTIVSKGLNVDFASGSVTDSGGVERFRVGLNSSNVYEVVGATVPQTAQHALAALAPAVVRSRSQRAAARAAAYQRAERMRAPAERMRAAAERMRAPAERMRAAAERTRAPAERMRAAAERMRAPALRAPAALRVRPAAAAAPAQPPAPARRPVAADASDAVSKHGASGEAITVGAPDTAVAVGDVDSLGAGGADVPDAVAKCGVVDKPGADGSDTMDVAAARDAVTGRRTMDELDVGGAADDVTVQADTGVERPAEGGAGGDNGIVVTVNDDRALSHEAFTLVYHQKLGIQPTLDAFASNDAKGEDALARSWCGEIVHASPPIDYIRAAIIKGLSDRNKAPQTTSVTIIMPCWPGSPHSMLNTPELAEYTHVHRFQVGEMVFTEPGDRGGRKAMGGVPWPVDVYHISAALETSVDVSAAAALHRILAHASPARMYSSGLAQQGVTRLQMERAAQMCIVCRITKSTAPPVHAGQRERAPLPYDLSYCDLLGPFAPDTRGYVFVMAVRCDATRHAASTLLRSRTEVASGLRRLAAALQNELGAHLGVRAGGSRPCVLRTLQCDSAAEFRGAGSAFAKVAAELGVTLRFVSPGLHASNGVVERWFRTLQDSMRAMLCGAGLPASYWGYAAMHATKMSNILPAGGGPSPLKLITGADPTLIGIHEFGVTAYIHLQPQQRKPSAVQPLLQGVGTAKKGADRAIQVRYVGYDLRSNDMMFVDADGMKVTMKSKAVFAPMKPIQALTRSAVPRTAFDVGKPPGAMLKRKVAAFQVVDMRATRRKERGAVADGDVADELSCVFKVTTLDYPYGIWSDAKFLLEGNAEGYDIVREAMVAFDRSHLYDPLFTIGTYHPDDDSAVRGPVECLVIGRDLAPVDKVDLVVAVRPRPGDTHPAIVDVPSANVVRKTELALLAPVDPFAELSEIKLSPHMYKSTHGELKSILSDDAVNSAVFLTPVVGEAGAGGALRRKAPRNIAQALLEPEWSSVVQLEWTTLNEMKTFKLLQELPPGKKAIPVLCKLNIKRDGKLKCRLVAAGNQQVPGVNYDAESKFAPTAPMHSVIVFLTYCVQRGLHLFSADATAAFANSVLNEEVYVELPHQLHSARFALLLKTLYGLKQSAHHWYEDQDALLMSIPGMKRNPHDPCWYFLVIPGSLCIHLLVYVDDYIIGVSDGPSSPWYKWFLSYYNMHYKLNDCGPLTSVLGFDADAGEGYLQLTRVGPTELLLEKYGLVDAHPLKYPLNRDTTLRLPEELLIDDRFRQLYGELSYLARTTRPDIKTALSKLGKYSAKHDHTHMNALLGVLRYLKGTQHIPFTIGKGIGGANGSVRLSVMVDASHNDCLDTARSTSGHLLFLNGSPVMFESKRQESVATSTAEAEIMALSAAVEDLLFLHQLVGSFDTVELPMVVYEDNHACISALSNPAAHGRTRHIHARYMRARELIQEGLIVIHPVATDDNVADYFTKPLSGEKFTKFRSVIMGHTKPFFPPLS